MRGSWEVAGDAEPDGVEFARLRMRSSIEGGEVELKGELPGERLSVFRGVDWEQASVPGDLQKLVR